jgi:hypothetical protein
VVRAARKRVGYSVKSALPVGQLEVKLVQLLLPPVMARLHEFEPEGVKKRSVVSTDCDRLTQKIMAPLMSGMH